MDTIVFSGYLAPKHIKISFRSDIRSRALYEEGGPLDGLIAEFVVVIVESQVQIKCHVNRILDSDYQHLLLSAYEQARSVVDLMAFSRGNGITLIIDQASYPDGRVFDVYHDDPSLPLLCTAYNTKPGKPDGSFDEILPLVMHDRKVMLALNDLTSTMEVPMRIRANCFRAVEAIKQSISDNGKPPKTWSILHDALNISDRYIEPLEIESGGPRHGDYFRKPRVQLSEAQIRHRAWTIMDRFLEYRKRGNVPLSDLTLL